MVRPIQIDFNPAVTALLQEVAALEVMPRFRHLEEGDVVEKSAGELVTIADRQAELALAAGLHRIDATARFVGEEACAADPSLLDGLDQGRVWLVDPIDGTANFAAGRAPFALMVALLEQGVAIASWLLDPLTGEVATAACGVGASVGGRCLIPTADLPPDEALAGIASTAFVPPGKEYLHARLMKAVGTVVPTRRCAGYEYPLVASGGRDFALYWRTLPWDHVPGALVVTEAGGVVSRLDGSDFVAGSNQTGLLVARNKRIAKRILEILN